VAFGTEGQTRRPLTLSPNRRGGHSGRVASGRGPERIRCAACGSQYEAPRRCPPSRGETDVIRGTWARDTSRDACRPRCGTSTGTIHYAGEASGKKDASRRRPPESEARRHPGRRHGGRVGGLGHSGPSSGGGWRHGLGQRSCSGGRSTTPGGRHLQHDHDSLPPVVLDRRPARVAGAVDGHEDPAGACLDSCTAALHRQPDRRTRQLLAEYRRFPEDIRGHQPAGRQVPRSAAVRAPTARWRFLRICMATSGTCWNRATRRRRTERGGRVAPAHQPAALGANLARMREVEWI